MSISNRIKHIDTWRLLAVALVIIYHVVSFSNFQHLSREFPAVAWRLAALGKFGVSIFFCISGFVICRGLMQEQANTTTISFTAFYLRRCLRLLPPLFLYVAALGVLGAYGLIQVTTFQLLQASFFLCNFKDLGDCGWYTGHTWSLAYEEQFYLLFPLLFTIIGFLSRPKILLLIITLLMAVAIFASNTAHPLVSEFCVTFVFMLSGCGFALYWEKLEPILSRTKPAVWMTGTTLMFIFAGLIVVPPPFSSFVGVVILPGFTCLVIFSTPMSHKYIQAFFGHSILSYIGKTSYSVYLWQQLATASYPSMAAWCTLGFVVLVFIFSHYSYQYMERPLIKLGAKWSTWLKNVQAPVQGETGSHPYGDEPFVPQREKMISAVIQTRVQP